jgi:hypothetical protein
MDCKRLHQAVHDISRILIAALLLATGAFAQSEKAVLHIPRVTRAPKLADFLNGTPREAEIAVTEFIQMDPTDGAPATQATTAYLSYDDRNLYVGWVCKDDPAKIRARIARRKDIGNDDRVTINIDTFHDHKHSFWFDVNPYAVQMDGRTTDGQGDDVNFETLWYTDGKLTEDGYVVLETIPFRSLRFANADVQSWGIALGRFIGRNNEWDWWPHISHSRSPQWVGQFADMEIKENISPGRNLQFIPYGLLSTGRFLDPATGFKTNSEARGGLDTKMVLKDALALDITLNPDFSQVESDEPQVTVNQRYEVTYAEKRPFFMENAQMFNTSEQLFFSRRIIDPQFGARMTGTLGRWMVGFLAADDRAPGKTLSVDDPLYNHRAIDAVFRVEREFGKQSHVGVLITSSDFGPTYNRVGSLDARVGLGGNWFFSGQATSTNTRFRDRTAEAGPGYFAQISTDGQHLAFSSTYTDRSPGFRADLGYIPRVDIRESKHRVSYVWRPKDSAIVSFGPVLSELVNWNRDGRVQDWSVAPEFDLGLRRLTYASVTHTESFELFQNIGFRKRRTEAYLSSEPYKWLAFSTNFGLGSGVNYYPAAGLPPFLGDSTSASLGVTLRPRPRLRLDESYIYSRLGADAAFMPASIAASGAIFNNHIIRSKLNYQFSRALSLRAIFDYNSLLPNPALVSISDSSKRIGTDLLLTYFVHPGTALYVGYNNTFENATYDPLQSPAYRHTQFPDTTTGRQFFVKLSYLFRY